MSNKIERVRENPLTTKTKPGTRLISSGILEEQSPILLNLFHNTEKETISPHSSYKARITLIPKSGKDTIKVENYS